MEENKVIMYLDDYNELLIKSHKYDKLMDERKTIKGSTPDEREPVKIKIRPEISD
ncbi:hypothetical protein [Staphylococcus xylosus]|uniref:hypothetical protein n=1 Tax=Staphylococcus xylosus TaxID=1288 RepID=UPI002DBD7DA3|nr:hypothetical protein [Staphylococcus xylosus]MEB8060623.1 hypothetical protein [Staphylococcus xylosus]